MFTKLVTLLFRLLPCAFDATNMNRLQGGTVTLWLYKTADVIATVVGSGYFSAYVNDLRENDVIIAVSTTGGAQAVDVLVVTSADNATPVTVTNGT